MDSTHHATAPTNGRSHTAEIHPALRAPTVGEYAICTVAATEIANHVTITPSSANFTSSSYTDRSKSALHAVSRAHSESPASARTATVIC